MRNVVGHMRLISSIMADRTKTLLNSTVNNMLLKDMLFFQKAILRYSFIIEAYELINMMPDIKEVLATLEHGLLCFFM